MSTKGISDSFLRYDGQVAIVTGAGAGMGATHALLLGERGAKVVVNDFYQEIAETTVKMIQQGGGVALAVAGDIGNPAVAEKIVKATIQEFGRIDILVNNAGIEIKKDFGDFTGAEFRKVMDVHVFGTWTLTNLCWPYMGALFGLMRSLAIEGEEFRITANALGPIAGTAMSKQMTQNDETQAHLERTAPAWMTSPVVAWLVHKDCKTSGEFISSCGYNMGRIFIAETPGVSLPDEDWSPETVRDHFEEALAEEGYTRASSTQALVHSLFKRMKQPKAA